MKRLTTLLMTLMLMSTALWADETITVTANSSDISQGLDLKVVAKLFAEAKDLEQFETMLNNPDSAFCNLDLNGDGQVDYLRVVEVGEGNKRLIVLQAILAKDIYQDVASIYVERDAQNKVSVQVIGDAYIYGDNYIIEPVYIYRPLIYDWFWSSAWFAWHSPWYWGYWPGWWYAHRCWDYDWYWHHCYAYHHHHYCCSFHTGQTVHSGYTEMHRDISRNDYAATHPKTDFRERNKGLTNAREIERTTTATRQTGNTTRTLEGGRKLDSRTFDSRTTVATRSTDTKQRSTGTVQTTQTGTTQRSTSTQTTKKGATGGQSLQRSTVATSSTVQRGTTSATSTSSSSQRTISSSSSSSSSSRSGSVVRGGGSSGSTLGGYSGGGSVSRGGGSSTGRSTGTVRR